LATGASVHTGTPRSISDSRNREVNAWPIVR
jgi:hypothetical protein